MIAMLVTLAAIVVVAASLPGTIELVLVTLGGVLPALRWPRWAAARPAPQRLVVVVPAHNEAAGIGRCVAGLRAAFRLDPLPAGGVDAAACPIVVVADNCSDDTAAQARRAGARVLERTDPNRRGKGYALQFAFGEVLEEGADAVVVVDADTVVEANFVDATRAVFAAGADAVQCRYLVLNPEASLRTRLMNVALFAFNALRPRGRERWGLSVGILGNGFGLSRATVIAVPYDAHSVVEDLEYHLRLVRSGRAVRFVDRTTVRADMPVGGRGVDTQRARWEGGRLRMIREVAPRLAREVAAGNWRLLEPLLELLLLPLAFHVVLLVAALVLPVPWARAYACAGLGVVVVHVLAGIVVGGGGLRDVAALAAAPFFIVWKVALAPAIVGASRKETTWVRTERADPGGDRP